jgi:outer membrane protein OmpA-like peptidoglycan-associated protein
MLLPVVSLSQNDPAGECINMFTINFPISDAALSNNKIIVSDQHVNAIYYLYQDKYTFWYKFVATESMNIDFSVSPSNSKDRYQAVVYNYQGADFCEKLVNTDLEPITVEKAAIFLPNEQLIYRNTIKAIQGEVYQIAVFSLNDDDCGHFLRVQAGNETLSINAIHRPCYNFETLTVPDFSMAKQLAPNVKLYLERYNKSIEVKDPEPKPTAAKEGFGSIQTIEVQSASEDLVTVGDRLVLNNVFFYSNTYAFKPGAETELAQLGQFLKDNPQVSVEVQGHTANSSENITPDPTFKKQGPEWNFKGSALKLSEKRAEAVRDYLLNSGIDKKRLRAVGYGDTQKRVANASTFEDSEKNMRVEVLVIE